MGESWFHLFLKWCFNNLPSFRHLGVFWGPQEERNLPKFISSTGEIWWRKFPLHGFSTSGEQIADLEIRSEIPYEDFQYSKLKKAYMWINILAASRQIIRPNLMTPALFRDQRFPSLRLWDCRKICSSMETMYSNGNYVFSKTHPSRLYDSSLSLPLSYFYNSVHCRE